MYDYLYHMSEDATVHHIGFVSNDFRYDLSLIYTKHFFGKTLVFCIQTGVSVLLDHSDLIDIDYVQKSFRLKSLQEALDISSFLQSRLTNLPAIEQY